MIDKILQEALKTGLKDPELQKNITSKIGEFAKKWKKYLIILIVVIIILWVLWIWLIWSIASGLLSAGLTTELSSIPGATESITKIQEVGVNGILEEPLKFIQEIWMGKDGK